MLYLVHGRGYTITVDGSLTKSHHKGGLIPPQSTSKTGPGHGCFSSTPYSQGSAIHKHQRYRSNGQPHSYHRGCGISHNQTCGTK